MYAANFTQFEKHSWFSLWPAVRATHDNQLCFVKTDNAFVHLHCSTQSITKKVLSFHLVLTLRLHQYRTGRVKRKKVDLYKYPLSALVCVLFKKYGWAFSSPVHMRCDSPANCGKTGFVAKFIPHVKQMMTPTPERIVCCYGERQRRTVPTGHWLQYGVSIIKYATGPTISALEIHHRK